MSKWFVQEAFIEWCFTRYQWNGPISLSLIKCNNTNIYMLVWSFAWRFMSICCTLLGNMKIVKCEQLHKKCKTITYKTHMRTKNISCNNGLCEKPLLNHVALGRVDSMFCSFVPAGRSGIVSQCGSRHASMPAPQLCNFPRWDMRIGMLALAKPRHCLRLSHHKLILWENLNVSQSVWENLNVSQSVWDFLNLGLAVWDHLKQFSRVFLDTRRGSSTTKIEHAPNIHARIMQQSTSEPKF
jgi:hypothetical protein